MSQLNDMIALTLANIETDHTRRMYARHLKRFTAWYAKTGFRKMDRATVLQYIETLSGAALPQSLSAIKKLAYVAAENGMIDRTKLAEIQGIRAPKTEGKRRAKPRAAGTILTRRQARKLLNAPNIATVTGLRDRAILAVLLGTGLQRTEVTTLQVSEIQHNKITLLRNGKPQTILMPEWVKRAIDAYRKAAKIKDGLLFRAINKHGQVRDRLSDTAVSQIVTEYADKTGLTGVTPDSLRQTFARLAYEAGADLADIQSALGHVRPDVTRKLIGLNMDTVRAPKAAAGDVLQLTRHGRKSPRLEGF